MYVKAWVIIVSTSLALGGYIGGMFLFITIFGRGPYSIVEAVLLVSLTILIMGLWPYLAWRLDRFSQNRQVRRTNPALRREMHDWSSHTFK